MIVREVPRLASILDDRGDVKDAMDHCADEVVVLAQKEEGKEMKASHRPVLPQRRRSGRLMAHHH